MSSAHMLDTESWSRHDIEGLLDKAKAYLPVQGVRLPTADTLMQRRIVLAFFEASTRTRMSFELAAQRLGASTFLFQPTGSSVEKGETLAATLRTLQAMGFDAIVLRHAVDGVHRTMAAALDIPIINAGEGVSAHPTQALLDASTLRERLGTLDGKNICIVGDVRHSRVARSNVDVLTKLGANIGLCAPDIFAPDDDVFASCRRFTSIDDAIKWADCISLLRIQRERITGGVMPSIDAYRMHYAMTLTRALAAPDVVIIHPGPVNLGIEIDTEVLDLPQTLIDRQVTHGVAVRMAVLERALL
ncbi:MAG: aspartate carbamoyltransferase catalytic subunit [Candidatus Kapabacteria bacterium]|nr:aspartate carbamoyltransferase catalytic subunit [Candidatus Kapabacteria bacterium]